MYRLFQFQAHFSPVLHQTSCPPFQSFMISRSCSSFSSSIDTLLTVFLSNICQYISLSPCSLYTSYVVLFSESSPAFILACSLKCPPCLPPSYPVTNSSLSLSIYLSIYLYLSISIYLSLSLSISIYRYLAISISFSISLYLCLCLYPSLYIHARAHTRTHAHTHTRTHTPPLPYPSLHFHPPLARLSCSLSLFLVSLACFSHSHPTVPKTAPLASGAVNAIAAGGYHNCILLTNGSLLCWGNNGYGQLGTGDTTNRIYPTAVFGLGPGEKTSKRSDSGLFTVVVIKATTNTRLYLKFYHRPLQGKKRIGFVCMYALLYSKQCKLEINACS